MRHKRKVGNSSFCSHIDRSIKCLTVIERLMNTEKRSVFAEMRIEIAFMEIENTLFYNLFIIIVVYSFQRFLSN